jgi:protein-disulfide isomerase
MAQQKNTGLVVGIVAVTVVLFVGLAVLVSQLPADPSVKNAGQPESVTFNDEGAQSIGPADAKVVVHLYSDFQCPACKFAEPAVKATMAAYKDRVRFVWKDFPLETIHRNARSAAEAARCAVDQGKFWEYHDELYAKQTEWESLSNPNEKLIQEAGAVGMNINTFSTCVQARTHTDLVKRDINEGFDNDVDRTPTVFINNRRYFAMNAAEWKKNLDAALQEVATAEK